jgi:hypothetical protein
VSRARSAGSLAAIAGLASCAAVVVTVAATVMAVLGGDLSCLGGGTALAQPVTAAAAKQIPPARLALYRAAGRRFDVDWTFLASIGTQECGSGDCAGDNGSGCAGPMQIANVRESPCSPGPGPTLWERFGLDANGDGVADVNDPADAIFAAARILRAVMGAPPAGGSYAAYRQAACNYYGACSDAAANYADEVMARAVSYGFRGAGGPPPAGQGASEAGAPSCSAPTLPSGAGPMGPVRKAWAPRRLLALPAGVGASPGIECDARIVPDVVYLARRFGVLVTACFAASGHEATGEHPLGAATDLVPRDGDWGRTMRLAQALGWKASCAASGAAPACARPPFRFIGYNGYPDHGDPLHCLPCAGGPHLHLSWLTSASPGEPESRPRFGYEPASWIEVFEVGGAPAGGSAAGGSGAPAPGRAKRGRSVPRRRRRRGHSNASPAPGPRTRARAGRA